MELRFDDGRQGPVRGLVARRSLLAEKGASERRVGEDLRTAFRRLSGRDENQRQDLARVEVLQPDRGAHLDVLRLALGRRDVAAEDDANGEQDQDRGNRGQDCIQNGA